MSFFSRIAGAVATFFQFGGPSGPGINDNAGVLEAKDSTNAVFAIMRGADPVNPNDFVTLEYFQAHPPSVNVPQALSQTRFQYWSGVPISLGGETFGSNCALLIGSTNLGVYQSATNLLQSCSRGTASNSSATGWVGSSDASANTGSYKNSFVLRGAAPGIGGFTHTTRFGIETVSAGPTPPTLQGFVGLIDASGGGGGLPQTAPNFITQTTLQVVGIAFTQNLAVSGFGNWQIVSCNGAVVTATDSGVPIVVGNLVELILVALPNAATIAWTINDLTAATSTSGVIAATLPANTLALAWQAGMDVVANGSATPNPNTFSTVRYTMDSNY